MLANFGQNGAEKQFNINLFMYLLHTARALSILCTCVQYWAPTRPICFVRGLNAAQNRPKLAKVGFLGVPKWLSGARTARGGA